jgi:hypothetical protein
VLLGRASQMGAHPPRQCRDGLVVALRRLLSAVGGVAANDACGNGEGRQQTDVVAPVATGSSQGAGGGGGTAAGRGHTLDPNPALRRRPCGRRLGPLVHGYGPGWRRPGFPGIAELLSAMSRSPSIGHSRRRDSTMRRKGTPMHSRFAELDWAPCGQVHRHDHIVSARSFSGWRKVGRRRTRGPRWTRRCVGFRLAHDLRGSIFAPMSSCRTSYA